MAEGQKTFVNNTDRPINITMFIRAGDSPEDEGGIQVVTIGAKAGDNNQVKAIYEGLAGSSGYVFLNALLIEWIDGPNSVGVSQRVLKRGDAWDNTLNANNTVTINDLAHGTLNATGSNK